MSSPGRPRAARGGTRPNGGEDLYEYDSAGRVSVAAGPFVNTWQGRYTLYDYTPVDSLDNGTHNPNEARTIIEIVGSAEVRRSYRSVRTNETLLIECQTPGAAWNATNNLITTNRTYTVGGSSNTVESVFYPDGTARFVSTPAFQPGVPRTHTESFGQPNSGGTAIVDGTRNTTEFDGAGRITVRETVDIASGSPLSRETYEYADDFGPAMRVVYLDGTSTSTTYGCCNATASVERDGTLTTYAYDALDRLVSTMRNGITFTNTFDAMGNILRTTRLGTDGSPMIVSEATFDTAGRQITSTQGGGTTTTTTSFGGSQVTTSYPDGGSRTDYYSQEGPLLSTSGTAAVPVSYEYGVEADGGTTRQFTKETRTGGNGDEWTKTYFDLLGRAYKTVLSDTNYTESFYNAKGQLWKVRGFDGRTTLLAYNARGEVEYTAIDVANPDVIDLAGTDRVTRTVSDVSGGKLRTRTYFFPTPASSNSVLISTRESTPDGSQATETRFGVTSGTQTEYLGGGVQRITESSGSGASTVSFLQEGSLLSVTRTGASGEELGRAVYGYDAHGRAVAVTDARTGTTVTNVYDEFDRLISFRTPALSGVPGQSTTLHHDGVGRMVRAVLPDGLNLTNEFGAQGQLLKTFGARTYPVQYAYDPQGRLTNMVTQSAAGAANTGWSYDPKRGWLKAKRYANAAGPDYGYMADGRIQTRTTPRGVTTYGYTSNGSLASLTYSTNGQNVAFLDLDRLDRPGRVTFGTNTALLAYHGSGLVVSETSGGLTMTNVFDGSLRKQTLELKRTNGASLLTHTYTYDGASRLATVSAGSVSVRYRYLGKSPLVQDVTFQSGSNLTLATTRNYDHLNRITEIGSAPGAAPALVFQYRHNLVNQRTNVTEADGSYWVYQYDSMGQLTSGKKYWSDNTPVAGQQFEYTFDAIGNRTATKAGGDASGGSLRSATYAPNTLNQYTNRTVPGAVDVLGHAPATASVTVNEAATYRKGTYWQTALSLNNASAAVWQGVTNVATLQGNRLTNRGDVFLPKTPEAFAYDSDGNLLSDGRWNLTWDAADRLVVAEARNDLPAGARKKLVFDYDWRGRRISKTVSNWNASTSSYQFSTRTQFAYDGWRLIAELDATQNPPTLLRSYVWGADMSGTLDGAGGVGGLLAMIDHVGGGTYFYAYDGNGNVRALVNAADGTIAAQYDFGPFGEPIRATGPMAKVSPFRWSTKYWDDETDFVDYGRRIYSPSLGRWLSRDPLEEEGGLNLVAFVGNNSANAYDPIGLNEVIVSGGCNANKGGWDVQGPINTGVEMPGRVMRWATGYGAHDRNWKNFITAAEAEIKRRKDKVKSGERIEWHVEINSYIARAASDGVARFTYINKIKQIAATHDVVLRWFGTKRGFAANINTSPVGEGRQGATRVSRFTYFGHGTKGQLDFHYVDAVQPSKNSQSLTREDINKGLLLKDAFMNNAIGISCGCNSATNAKDSKQAKGSLKDVWEGYFGFTLYGVNARVDYANPENPQPSSGGEWQPGAPPNE